MMDEPIVHLIIKRIDKRKNDTYITIMCQNEVPWEKLSPGAGSTNILSVTCARCHLEAMKLKERNGVNGKSLRYGWENKREL